MAKSTLYNMYLQNVKIKFNHCLINQVQGI